MIKVIIRQTVSLKTFQSEKKSVKNEKKPSNHFLTQRNLGFGLNDCFVSHSYLNINVRGLATVCLRGA